VNAYSLKIKESAAKALSRIPKGDRVRLVHRIEQLRVNPVAGSVLKGEFEGLRRIRVGDYRVIYEVHDQELVVLVVRVAHRREAYR